MVMTKWEITHLWDTLYLWCSILRFQFHSRQYKFQNCIFDVCFIDAYDICDFDLHMGTNTYCEYIDSSFTRELFAEYF